MSAEGTTFLKRLHEANAAFVQGEVTPMLAIWSHQDDVSLMGAFGAYERGWDAVHSRLQWACSQFHDGVQEDEEVASSFHEGFGWRASVERIRARLGNASEGGLTTLRVTQVFRREDADWRVMHRHADILRPREAPTRT